VRAAAVVVNFNGGDDLARCLDALARQTVAVDVVLVDCASTDGSRSLAERPPEGVRGVPLNVNRGYAGGCNAGLAVLAGDVEVVAFLNPDCFPEPDFFAVCLQALGREPSLAGVAARLIRPDRTTLDSCGQVLTPVLLRVRDRGYGRPAAGTYSDPQVVLAACGAAMVYRRSALEDVSVCGEVLPSEFFAFWEDLDLGWRVRNAGLAIVYEPTAVAIHRRGGTAAPGAGRLIFRRSPNLAAAIILNRWATLLRNLHWVDFFLRLPVLLMADAVMATLVIVRRPRVLPAVVRGASRLRGAWAARRTLPRRRLGELQ
jgi:GT2 family glycosyltransferase